MQKTKCDFGSCASVFPENLMVKYDALKYTHFTPNLGCKCLLTNMLECSSVRPQSHSMFGQYNVNTYKHDHDLRLRPSLVARVHLYLKTKFLSNSIIMFIICTEHWVSLCRYLEKISVLLYIENLLKGLSKIDFFIE